MSSDDSKSVPGELTGGDNKNTSSDSAGDDNKNTSSDSAGDDNKNTSSDSAGDDLTSKLADMLTGGLAGGMPSVFVEPSREFIGMIYLLIQLVDRKVISRDDFVKDIRWYYYMDTGSHLAPPDMVKLVGHDLLKKYSESCAANAESFKRRREKFGALGDMFDDIKDTAKKVESEFLAATGGVDEETTDEVSDSV